MFTIQDTITANQELQKVNKLQIKKGVLILNEQANDFEYITINNNEKIVGVEFSSELKKLKYLNLAGCKLKNIVFPKDCCRNIEAIHLEKNGLETITFESNLPKLRVLGLNKNNIEQFSLPFEFENLQYIDISENESLKDFSSLGKFISRDNFDFSLRGNDSLKEPPIEIVKQGNDAIRNYYKQKSKYGTEIFYEAKIIIVGEAKAGKTTLRHLLAGKDINIPATIEEQPSTHGINVEKDIKFDHLHLNNVQICTNIWDFGGQDIQYNLHHYFLSPDALYILVTDLRPEKTRFTYWFQAIDFFGSKNTPIIVIKNDHGDADNNDVDIEQYKRDFPELAKNILDFRLNLAKIKDENKSDWNNIRNYAISKQLEKLETVGSEGIKIWSDIKEIFVAEKKPFLELDDLIEKAGKKGMNSEEDIKYMLKYFHRIGIIIYYEDDGFLSNYVFIKPEWITENLYTAITENNISENGIFKDKELFDFWKQKRIKQTERTVLLELMGKEKFDVAYPLENNKYAVPILFKDKTLEYSPFPEDTLNLKFKFDRFLPKGLLSRFIVRMYENIEHNQAGVDLAWKTGVVLEKEGTRAVVLELTDSKTIDIKIAGRDKISYRSIIIDTFEKLFDRYPNKPDLLIPCDCEKCSIDKSNAEFYSYTELLEFIDDEAEIQCRKSRKMRDPSKLLHGIKMFGEKSRGGDFEGKSSVEVNVNIKPNDEIIEELEKLHERHDKHDEDNKLIQELQKETKKELEKLSPELQRLSKKIISEIKNTEKKLFRDTAEEGKFRKEVKLFIANIKDEKEREKAQKILDDDRVDMTSKVKIGVNLAYLIPFLIAKYEIEFSSGKTKVPRNWKEFKALFIKEKEK